MLHFSSGRSTAAVLASALAFAMAISCFAPAFAAGGVVGNLTGTVDDAATGRPIANVRILAASGSGSYRATSDAAGRFSFLGLPSDSYNVSFEKEGYTPFTVTGVQVFGDETDSVGVVKLQGALKTIVRVTARARNGAFQPTQTQDVTTLSGQRITQALGSATSQNEQNLILAAPGAQQDQSGNITIRGSNAVELGYQYDGVNFSVPFFDGNGSNGYLNNIAGGSGGSLQVVSGSGDATQGNIGAGVINIVPPRGTYPQKGLVGLTVGAPFFQHQADFSYGFATANNRFSDYFSYDGSRVVPQYAPFGADASALSTPAFPTGRYGGTSYIAHDDIVNNLIYRFGKHNDQSFQVLLRNAQTNSLGNYGGLAGAAFYPYNALAMASYAPSFPGGQAQLASVVPLLPGVPATNVNPTQAELVGYVPLRFIKLGYTWNINPSTFLDVRYDNFTTFTGGTNFTTGATFPFVQEVGGQIVGTGIDLTHQFGARHTVTLSLKYDDNLPRWYQAGTGDQTTLNALTGNAGAQFAPSVDDWYLPQNPGQPISAANPCVGLNGPDPNGCYIYSQLLSQGLWNGTLPRIPTSGIDYHHAIFHESGIGLRDQFAASDRLHLDYGLRIDIDKLDYGRNPFAIGNIPDPLGDPSNVAPSVLGSDYLNPKVWQPRFAASYQIDANNALRFSYGRSVEFFFAQTAGTPQDMQNVDPILYKIAPKDNAANPGCGSGWYTSGPPPNGATGQFYQCVNYPEQLFWLGDQHFDAPDVGGFGPPTYNNFDLAWSHQFTRGAMSGWGLKLTGFARRGYNVEENTLIANSAPNPITGQAAASVFSTRAEGVEKTTGLEFMLTTPDRPVGFSGFLTATYISQFSSTPPVGGGGNGGAFNSDALPILNSYLFNSGQLFRSGVLPPLQGRLGLEYHMKDGIKINPILSFDGGFPTGVGSQTYNAVNGQYLWIPETNFGAATPIGGPNGPGFPINSSYYVDPANPGSYLKPNIAASRGYAEPALPGNKLTNPHAYLDLDLEYSPPSSPYTLGVYVTNIFNNHYGLWYPNTAWQPVATGIGGPQTGKFTGAYPGSALYNTGARDTFAPTFGQSGPFVVPYNPGTTFQVYLQKRL